MTADHVLRDKLRKIEALFAGAATPGERAAAGAAAERIRARLKQAERTEAIVETRFSLPDPWSHQLFCALVHRYGLTPFRYHRMRRTSVVVRAPASFVEAVLWPEFQELDDALRSYLSGITDKFIREEIHRAGGEADEVREAGG